MLIRVIYLFITMASHCQGPHCPVGSSGKKVNEWYPQTFYCLFCFHVTFSSLAFIVKVVVINVGSFKHSEPQNDRRTWAHNKGYSDFQHVIASPCVSMHSGTLDPFYVNWASIMHDNTALFILFFYLFLTFKLYWNLPSIYTKMW